MSWSYEENLCVQMLVVSHRKIRGTQCDEFNVLSPNASKVKLDKVPFIMENQVQLCCFRPPIYILMIIIVNCVLIKYFFHISTKISQLNAIVE